VDERRNAPRMRTLKAAKIILSDKSPRIDCAVRNLSGTGARLEVSTSFGVPTKFDLILDGERRHCRVAWMNETMIGVSFI
jgi:PilZ domain-containing protein